MVSVYRGGVYRGVGGSTEDSTYIRTSVFYPYASQSSSQYSHGVCRIVDVRSPFGAYGPVTMHPNHADYDGPSSMQSNAIFPIYQKSTPMRLMILGAMHFIVTDEEPLYMDDAGVKRYYTYGNNGVTPYVSSLLSAGVSSNKYLINMIDSTFLLPDTGDLEVYGFFAMLNVLSLYKTRARNYIYKISGSTTMLDDYLSNRELFFNEGVFGWPTIGNPVWRALPESKLVDSLLPETTVGDIEDMRDGIVEFLVDNVYSAYSVLWDNIDIAGRGTV